MTPSFTFLPGRKDATDGEADKGSRDGGKLVANPLQCCCLLFQASIATLQVAPVLNDLSSRADALVDLTGR